MGRGVGALVGRAIEPVLEVELVGERAAGLEALAQGALTVFDEPLGLGVALGADVPADPQLAAEAGEVLGRSAATGMKRSLAVGDEELRQAAETLEAAAERPEEIGRLFE
jgi:hypothetical protein